MTVKTACRRNRVEVTRAEGEVVEAARAGSDSPESPPHTVPPQAGGAGAPGALLPVVSSDVLPDLAEEVMPEGSAIESLFSTSKYSFELTCPTCP